MLKHELWHLTHSDFTPNVPPGWRLLRAGDVVSVGDCCFLQCDDDDELPSLYPCRESIGMVIAEDQAEHVHKIAGSYVERDDNNGRFFVRRMTAAEVQDAQA